MVTTSIWTSENVGKKWLTTTNSNFDDDSICILDKQHIRSPQGIYTSLCSAEYEQTERKRVQTTSTFSVVLNRDAEIFALLAELFFGLKEAFRTVDIQSLSNPRTVNSAQNEFWTKARNRK